ncbi:MAG: ribonuclease P protein component [Pirellulaceae bacterium]
MNQRGPCRRNESFPPELRVRSADDYRRAFEAGGVAADGTLVVIAVPNGLDHSRLGVIASRQVGNSVVRHRWKRVVREAYRRQREKLPNGYDYVVRPKRGAVCQWSLIERGILPLTRRAISRIGKPQPPRSRKKPG